MPADLGHALRIGVIHPDLGIGGAERLVVDAATGLKAAGHHVEIFTSFHDPQRCFKETVDGTLSVHVLGDAVFPRSLAGRFNILCAILRQLSLILSLVWSLLLHRILPASLSQKALRDSHDWPFWRSTPPFDVFFVDQLSVGIPMLRWLSNTRVLFYCHFPDLLMNPDRTGKSSLLRTVYRMPFDLLEEKTTGASACDLRYSALQRRADCADKILVNSDFTAQTFVKTFPALRRLPRVVYPGIDTRNFSTPAPRQTLLGDRQILLSINRFEQKKHLQLALDAFAKLGAVKDLTLVFAGGYDDRLTDNVETLKSLENRAYELELSNITHADATNDLLASSTAAVVFLPNLPEEAKLALLKSQNTAALLYTPSNEHLGIVPLEAMAAGLPVLACASGGPLETIDDPATGRLRPPNPDVWATAIQQLVSLSSSERKAMSEAGRKRVEEKFGLQTMANELERALREVRALDATKGPVNREDGFLLAVAMLVLSATCVLVALLVFGWSAERRVQDTYASPFLEIVRPKKRAVR